MEIDGYIPRTADVVVDSYLKSFGAVCIEGPKWCGKTWTAKRHAASAGTDVRYRESAAV